VMDSPHTPPRKRKRKAGRPAAAPMEEPEPAAANEQPAEPESAADESDEEQAAPRTPFEMFKRKYINSMRDEGLSSKKMAKKAKKAYLKMSDEQLMALDAKYKRSSGRRQKRPQADI